MPQRDDDEESEKVQLELLFCFYFFFFLALAYLLQTLLKCIHLGTVVVAYEKRHFMFNEASFLPHSFPSPVSAFRASVLSGLQDLGRACKIVKKAAQPI